jgi:hypothetical protein
MIRDGLDDRMMGHIFRFLRLGPFDRAEWERERAYADFKRRHRKRMEEAAAQRQADGPQGEERGRSASQERAPAAICLDAGETSKLD